ncbi:MAG: hypothetical protein HY369_03265 [Candidatus Aenigmarchaeota archaeon]|nr:hypothetical protein [Candidatus Aenigmarchaeota archaeon]
MDITISGHKALTGEKKEDPFNTMIVDKQIRNELAKLSRRILINHLMVHLDRHHEEGKRVKYSVKVRMMTERGSYFSHDYAWDIAGAVRGALRNLEREVVKDIEKSRGKSRPRGL